MKFRDYSQRILNNGDRELVFKDMIDEIRKDKELEKIFLGENRLTEKHIEQLANALSEHTNLKFIDLSYNEIKAAAIPFLKKIIQEHPELNTLRLEHNHIKDEGIKALVENNSVELNKKISKVDFDLACNRISETGLEEARELLSLDSIASILMGNPILDQELIQECKKDLRSKLNSEKTNVEPKTFTPLASMASSPADKKDSPKRKAENQSESTIPKMEKIFTPEGKEFVANANQEQLEHFIKSTRDIWEQEHKKPRTEQTDRPFNNKGITT